MFPSGIVVEIGLIMKLFSTPLLRCERLGREAQEPSWASSGEI